MTTDAAPSDQSPDARHPLDEFIADPTGLPPQGDPDQFAGFVDEMVADEAPRLFAIVQEYGDRVDGWIAAWGLAFEDYADVVTVDGCARLRLRAPDRALRAFSIGSHIRARVSWVSDSEVP